MHDVNDPGTEKPSTTPMLLSCRTFALIFLILTCSKANLSVKNKAENGKMPENTEELLPADSEEDLVPELPEQTSLNILKAEFADDAINIQWEDSGKNLVQFHLIIAADKHCKSAVLDLPSLEGKKYSFINPEPGSYFVCLSSVDASGLSYLAKNNGIKVIVPTAAEISDAPTISAIADQTINEDANTGAITFTIAAVEPGIDCGTSLGKVSTNTILVPLGGIVFGGAGLSCTVTITPAANQYGTATITISVTDTTSTVNEAFLLTVSAMNDAPTLTTNSAMTAYAGQDNTIGVAQLAGSDLDDVSSALVFVVKSLPSRGQIQLAGTGLELDETFTQADIVAGDLSYEHTAAAGLGADSFTFALRDAANAYAAGATDGSPATFNVTAAGYCTQGSYSSAIDWDAILDNGVYMICTKEQFLDIGATGGAAWAANFALRADLDLVGQSVTPIGDGTTHFTGSFDGKSKKIANLSISSVANYQALFGSVSGTNGNAAIKNLIVEDGSVSGAGNLSLLVGYLLAGDIRDVSVSGTLVPTATKNGGVAGQVAVGASVSRVQCHMQIAGDAPTNGACIGLNGGTITQAFGNSYIQGQYYLGGIVGRQTIEATLSQSQANFSAGYSSGTYSSAGGLVGQNLGYISESTAEVYMLNSQVGIDRVGGLVGHHDSGAGSATQCEIIHSYSKGYIENSPCAECGGVVGKIDTCAITKSYADVTIKYNAASTLNGYVTGGGASPTYSDVLGVKTMNYNHGIAAQGGNANLFTRLREEMSRESLLSVYHGFDFNTKWKIPALGGSAVLKWEIENFDFDFKLDNGWKIGKSQESAFPISGTCPVNDQTLQIRGSVNSTVACTSNAWSTTLDVSSLADGLIVVSVVLPDDWDNTPSRPYAIGRVFTKETADCVSDINGASLGYKGDGLIGSPYVLCIPANYTTLKNTSGLWSSYIKLGDHLDISTESNHSRIGNGTTNFTGSFDGNNFSIANLNYVAAADSVGFISHLATGSVVRNLIFLNPILDGATYVGPIPYIIGTATVENIRVYGTPDSITDIKGDSYTGGAIGFAQGGSALLDLIVVENIQVERDTADLATGQQIGGVVGRLDAVLKNSYSSGSSVTNVDYWYAGGLVGSMQNGAKIYASYSDNEVVGTVGTGGLVGVAQENSNREIKWSYATGNVSGTDDVGGLIGRYYAPTLLMTLDDVYATGDVTGDAGDVGGLIGYNQGQLSRCYSTGQVETADTSAAGGLLGVQGARPVTNCMSSSVVTETGNNTGDVGGFIGRFVATSSVSYSYARGQVVPNGFSASGGFIGDVSSTSNLTCTDVFFAYDVSIGTFGTRQSDGVGAAADPTNCVGGTHVLQAIESELKDQSFYPVGWDFTNSWLIIDDQTYPIPRWNKN